MPHNALIFHGRHLEEAHYAALDPASDVVLVKQVVDSTGNPKLDWLNAMQRLHGLTPLMTEWWKQRELMRHSSDQIRLIHQQIDQKNINPHIDMISVVGYVVSYNYGDTPRSFYASRHGVPCVASETGIKTTERQEFRDTLGATTRMPTEDYITLNPGDAALFGALPCLAIHAAEGDTLDAEIVGWQPDSIRLHF